MQTKKCGKCQQVRPISEFYPHGRDGFQSECKDCKRERAKIYNRTPKRREYNRQFYERLKNEGYFKEYRQRPEVKKRKAKQIKEYSLDPRLRVRFLARWYARRMVKNGTIKQQPCALCGNENSLKHHPDYTKPLLIVWLCADCHRELHKRAKAELKE